jgi:hypothetical protein
MRRKTNKMSKQYIRHFLFSILTYC